MKFSRKDLEELRKDPMSRHLAGLMGINLDKEIDNMLREMDAKSKAGPFDVKSMINSLDDLVKQGVLDCEERDGVKHYSTHVEIPKEPTPVNNEEDAEKASFLMNVEQLEKFVRNYRELIAAQKKLGYMYGIKFDEGESGFGFPSKADEIIWDLIRIIFGEENREDIADFVCGNSNFDSVEALYDELV